MASILHLLPRTVLENLARALASNRIHPPYSGFALHAWLNSELQPQVAAELERLRSAGMTSAQIAMVIDLLAVERARQAHGGRQLAEDDQRRGPERGLPAIMPPLVSTTDSILRPARA